MVMGDRRIDYIIARAATPIWNDGSCFYLMVSQTASPLTLASTIFCLSS